MLFYTMCHEFEDVLCAGFCMWYVWDFVCVMCRVKCALCAICSLSYVWSLVFVMCSL